MQTVKPLRAHDVLCSFFDDEQVARRRANRGDDVPIEICMELESNQEDALAQSKTHGRVHSQQERCQTLESVKASSSLEKSSALHQ